MDVIYFTLCLSYEIIVANKHLHTIQENIDWSLVNLNFAQDIQIVVGIIININQWSLVVLLTLIIHIIIFIMSFIGLAIFFCVVSFIADILLARSADTFRQTVSIIKFCNVSFNILFRLIRIKVYSVYLIGWSWYSYFLGYSYNSFNTNKNSSNLYFFNCLGII